MEIWIIGGVFVILMVIVSTAIKRAAANAYIREVIETDEFTVVKPEGFLHPIRERADFPFEAYSKEYGERSTRNIWRARARLRIHEGVSIDDLLETAKESGEISGYEIVEDRGGRRCVVSGGKTEDETEYIVRRKLIEPAGRAVTFEMKVTTLALYDPEFESRAAVLLETFEVRGTGTGEE